MKIGEQLFIYNYKTNQEELATVINWCKRYTCTYKIARNCLMTDKGSAYKVTGLAVKGWDDEGITFMDKDRYIIPGYSISFCDGNN